MKLSELDNLFKNKIDINFFKELINVEITDYKNKISKKGGSSSIYLEHDIEMFSINKRDIIFLCSAFLHKRIDKWELNYIAEALMFATFEKMMNSEILFALEALTDPEYEKMVDDNYIKTILQELV